MEIRILQLLEGARQSQGLAVVIDVFRAFSLGCYIADKGVSRYYVTSNINLAYRLKELHSDYLLIGERNERIPSGFDYGNSPTHLYPVVLEGKTVVHTTSAGTRGLILAAQSAQEVITGSLVNAMAIVNYIKQRNPSVVSLVCMGYAAQYPTEEDTLCAEYIKSLLEGKHFPIEQEIDALKNTSGQRLFLPENQQHSPASDFDFCTALNRFSFVLKADQPIGIEDVMALDGYDQAEIFQLQKIPVF
ncbi:MAG TPA: 2-phosphosulfolactate phosphatase [Bacteroidales bacterium]|nr:2-phosphosulfolactate phosphatase [Bacteroidales bacterium]HOK98258.1 2-phosphosulfolactate phosphatase [Bacteroidales bacterium]HPO65667.1 2-phosphosulfolactate phosphatase [Bacteroidales bacterium]